MSATLEQLTIADAPDAWRRRGFTVEGERCELGSASIRLAGDAEGPGPGGGLIGWSLRGVDPDADLDGLPDQTFLSLGPLYDPQAQARHPNGVTAIDHVVAISPDLDRTVAALEAAGLDLRRVREEPTPAGAPRQAFFRLGEPILEVVQAPPEAIERSGGPDGPAFLWGIALVAPDLDASVAAIGPELVSGPRDAVQPGRRIATLRGSAGLSLPVALMSPAPGRSR